MLGRGPGRMHGWRGGLHFENSLVAEDLTKLWQVAFDPCSYEVLSKLSQRMLLIRTSCFFSAEAKRTKFPTWHKNAFLWIPSDRSCGQSQGCENPAGVFQAPLAFSGRMQFLPLEQ